MVTLRLSKLSKTWIIDLDGTIFPHNGHLTGIQEKPLEGVKDLFKQFSEEDLIIILTSRKEEYREWTVNSLKESKIRFDLLLMDMPKGERILINDRKESGLETAYSVCVERDAGLRNIQIVLDDCR